MNDALTGQTVELLQQLIRNQCVNDGTVGSGQEVRTSDVLRAYLEGTGLARSYPAQDVAIYLNTLLWQDPEAWGMLAEIPESRLA